MAETTYPEACGITVTLFGAPLRAIYSLNIQGAAGPSKGRDAFWTDDAGGASLSLFGALPANLQAQTGLFTVDGGTTSLSQNAIVTGVDVEYELNGLVRTSLEIKFIA